ncbi:unnamed protein product [Rotaria sordida]|uniref:Secreted protein n=1 Tax=Rotaria sordida TaxID=392033 RepID=A0A815S433_9BILA|nr:unnamed protein product [Rotaria sordida]CAF1484614.1 unnamed protein product [Rotaria sordida]
MFVLVLVVAFVLVHSTHSYYVCNCYCPSRTSFVGTALSFTCSTSACSTACLGNFVHKKPCSSPLKTYGTCKKGFKRSIKP